MYVRRATIRRRGLGDGYSVLQSIYDFGYNAVTGGLTDAQRAAIAAQNAADLIHAGADPATAAAQANADVQAVRALQAETPGSNLGTWLLVGGAVAAGGALLLLAGNRGRR